VAQVARERGHGVRSLHAAFFKEPDPKIFDVAARKSLA
jgi:hypothetical protein